MNKQIILVKHSLPEIIQDIPAWQWHLSEVGRVRAGQLSEKLLLYQPEVLISSTEPKAIETAEVIARKTQLSVHILENLHEHERSKVAYLTKDEFENAVREFFAKPDTLVFGNETANEAYKRFSVAVFAALNAYPDKTAIIVSHGTVISLFISRLTGISASQLWNELGLPSYVVLDTNSNTLVTKENIS
jgi:broad specificity phosphatase PhoE